MFDEYWEKQVKKIKDIYPGIEQETIDFAKWIAYEAWTEAQLERSFWEPD